MSRPEDFLLEIHTEELPPKSLSHLAKALQQEMEKQLEKANLKFKAAQTYVSPRRLALYMQDVATEQAAQTIERKGPALNAAYDKEGKPTQACQGFARSCGIEPKDLMTIKNAGGEWVGYREEVPGKSTRSLLPAMIQQSLAALPIPKRMRWGERTESFIRPVHSVLALFGKEVLEATILGQVAGQMTYGHRFHYPKALKISSPKSYAATLEKKAYVIADFEKRKALVRSQTEQVVQDILGPDAKIIMDEGLLNEVTGIVEWPVAICGRFDAEFLSVPAPVLISAMQDHQRYFPIVDKNQQLLPYFAAVMNIASKDPARVVAGNERVLRARLSDAKFFFEKDKTQSLESRVQALKGIVFQAKLGTLYDKAERISKLSKLLAKELQLDERTAERAALLAKADLTSEMVGEFPELQGEIGYYYALHDKETQEIAQAITDHYKPRFSGDSLPQPGIGCMVALADRIDTLIGIFGIGQIPTGDKDPFGLRRAAIGVLRLIIENRLDLDMLPLLTEAAKLYGNLENKEVVSQVLRFMQDRLKAWYQEQDISPDVFAAVAALNSSRFADMHRRILAVQHFKGLPGAESLSMANKRVSNILSQYTETISAKTVNPDLFEDESEKDLARALNDQAERNAPLYQAANYVEVLNNLATLRAPIDQFFDKVMVMAEDKAIRENRLLMLGQLRTLFLQVADIALLVARA